MATQGCDPTLATAYTVLGKAKMSCLLFLITVEIPKQSLTSNAYIIPVSSKRINPGVWGRAPEAKDFI